LLGIAHLSQLPRPTRPHDPVSFAKLAAPACCKRCDVRTVPQRDLAGKFTDTLCELAFAAIAARMIAAAMCFEAHSALSSI
jgi:hypothetical protein